MYCQKCMEKGVKGPIKPNIVFFGEGLPDEFQELWMSMDQVDLLMVMGTALAVSPFNMLPTMLGRDIPKVLFNLDNTKETGGYDFTKSNENKLFVQGKCDETLAKLVKDCGWMDDFNAVLPEYHAKIE